MSGQVIEQKFDVSFRAFGSGTIPSEHGSPLHGALSKRFPDLFHGTGACGIHPIGGRQAGNRKLQLGDTSKLTIRTSPEHLAKLVGLTSAQLRIAGSRVRLGPPTVYPLVPAVALQCRLLTIKLDDPLNESQFCKSVRRKLDSIDVRESVKITLLAKHTVHIHNREIIGYRVRLDGLNESESIAVQSANVWSRRSLGCGIFIPVNAIDTVKS